MLIQRVHAQLPETVDGASELGKIVGRETDSVDAVDAVRALLDSGHISQDEFHVLSQQARHAKRHDSQGKDHRRQRSNVERHAARARAAAALVRPTTKPKAKLAFKPNQVGDLAGKMVVGSMVDQGKRAVHRVPEVAVLSEIAAAVAVAPKFDPKTGVGIVFKRMSHAKARFKRNEEERQSTAVPVTPKFDPKTGLLLAAPRSEVVQGGSKLGSDMKAQYKSNKEEQHTNRDQKTLQQMVDAEKRAVVLSPAKKDETTNVSQEPYHEAKEQAQKATVEQAHTEKHDQLTAKHVFDTLEMQQQHQAAIKEMEQKHLDHKSVTKQRSQQLRSLHEAALVQVAAKHALALEQAVLQKGEQHASALEQEVQQKEKQHAEVMEQTVQRVKEQHASDTAQRVQQQQTEHCAAMEQAVQHAVQVEATKHKMEISKLTHQNKLAMERAVMEQQQQHEEKMTQATDSKVQAVKKEQTRHAATKEHALKDRKAAEEKLASVSRTATAQKQKVEQTRALVGLQEEKAVSQRRHVFYFFSAYYVAACLLLLCAIMRSGFLRLAQQFR